MANKLAIVNTIACHTLLRNITHSAIITHETVEKLKIVALFQFPLSKYRGLRVITAKCLLLRCKVRKTNLFRVVDLCTTSNFIAL